MNTPLLTLALVSASALLLAPAQPVSAPTLPAQPVPASPALAPAALELEFPQASPPCKLEQRIGLTDVSVHFSRPGVKGRKVFGVLEPWGQVWRTGANEATTIEFSQDVVFGGADVPAGTYTLFSIPGEKEWTVILNKTTGQWGAYAYDEKTDLARVKAKPQALAETVETFAFGFSDVRATSANLYFEWERVRVPVVIETRVVETLVPQIAEVMAGTGEKPYFAAAMFYYDNGLDMKQAAAWIDQAIAKQPDALWMIYRKGLILEKLGDKPRALEAARKSLELASKAKGLLKDEYTRLNQALIERLH